MSDNERLSVAVTVDWTDALQKKIRERYLYLAPGAAAVSFEPGLVHIDFPSDDPQPRPDQQAVADFVADQQRSLGRASERVLLAHDSARPAIPDPLPDLIERGEVSETADGAFTFAGAFARRFTAWDGLVRDLADRLQAEERIVPTLLRTSSLFANGYLADFPHHALFVAPARYDVDALRSIAAVGKSAVDGEETVRENLGAPAVTLAPTVCYHCFESLRDRRLASPHVGITAFGHCHRFESRNISGLKRLQHFSMRELVFLGDADYVARSLDACVDFAVELLKAWDVTFRISTASDPFFLGESDRKTTYQLAMAMKRELQIQLPYDGSWLSVGSFNNHARVIIDKYGIEIEGAEKPASGCVGFGYERLLFALHAHFGLEDGDWPDALRG